jgi:hypothetical protein
MDPEFEADGLHYTAASGLLYVEHLVHVTHSIIESSVKPDPVAQSHSSQLQGICHEVSELRFNQILISAKQEEETDGRLNSEAENQFVIAGLKVANSSTWQERHPGYPCSLRCSQGLCQGLPAGKPTGPGQCQLL